MVCDEMGGGKALSEWMDGWVWCGVCGMSVSIGGWVVI